MSLKDQNSDRVVPASYIFQCILTKLNYLLQITKEDLLPSHICHGCFGALKNAFEFRQRCERSDTTLRAILKQSFEDYMDSLKSGEESNHMEGDIMPVVEVKVERDNEGSEVSKALDNLPPKHLMVERTGLAENSDQDNCNSTCENNFQVYIIF